jgi:hypothetical protein
VSAWRQQAVVEAPVSDVWALISDPARYPHWAKGVLDVTGVPKIEEGATFEQVTRDARGKPERTTFEVEELEDMRRLKMRCQATGFYSSWLLTEARDATFVDLEIGMDPVGIGPRLFTATLGKRWFRSLVDGTLDGLREAVAKATAQKAQ